LIHHPRHLVGNFIQPVPEQARFAVVYAFADREKWSMDQLAELAGVSTRQAYRLRTDPAVAAACCEVYRRLAPPCFRRLGMGVAMMAERLADQLIAGRKMGELSKSELWLAELGLRAVGIDAGGKLASLKLTAPDGSSAEYSVADGGVGDVLDQELKELEGKMRGRLAAASVRGDGQSLPGDPEAGARLIETAGAVDVDREAGARLIEVPGEALLEGERSVGSEPIADGDPETAEAGAEGQCSPARQFVSQTDSQRGGQAA